MALLTSGGAFTQEQVSVAVKVIEFQTGSTLETGLSAYFKRVARENRWGTLITPNGAISAADITFPTSTVAGLTVFLDRISSEYGEFELILQALEDQNRAFILSRPRAMVPVGEATPTVIETVQRIPYEDTKVFGATAKQITNFRDAGVFLSVQATEILDDDGDKRTTHDTYVRLKLTARVNEEGRRITVALDDLIPDSGNLFGSAQNELSVPEFVSREIVTDVWVPHGQVLLLGGLFRTTTTKNSASVPWLAQAEDMIASTASRVLPFTAPGVPLTATFGSRDEEENRRELVFLVRAERWLPSQTVADEFGFLEDEDNGDGEGKESGDGKKGSPTDVITDVLKGISNIPRGVAEGISGVPEDENSVERQLGAEP